MSKYAYSYGMRREGPGRSQSLGRASQGTKSPLARGCFAPAGATQRQTQFELYAVVIIIDPIELVKTEEGIDFSVPVIADALTNSAQIQVEASPYVSPDNVPLLIAEKGNYYEKLSETDRAAWLLPQEFESGYTIILNETLDQVLVVYETYRIIYANLHGAENLNPNSYTTNDLPIILRDPGQRLGYIFKGWYDAEGQRITEIPLDKTGDITLTAAWEKVFLIFIGNAPCVSDMPEAINVESRETIPIPGTIPQRSCYCFAGWNTSPSGCGTSYAPGGVITMPDGSIELYAQWRRKSNCGHHNHYQD